MKKKTTIKKKYNKKEKNGLLKFVFLTGFIVLLGLALFLQNSQKPTQISNIASETTKKSIQLGTFTLPSSAVPNTTITSNPQIPTKTPTPTPTPSNACSHDTGTTINPDLCKCVAVVLQCENKMCKTANYDARVTDTGDLCYTFTRNGGHADPCKQLADGYYCYGKPIIYLYPTMPMLVDVSIETSGEIFVSDPLYPEGGWKNILAHPSGKLEYEGKTYKELFYESNITDLHVPIHGLTLKTESIEGELDMVLTKLGLIGYEKKDFIEFWAPRLRALNTPYIFFSTISEAEKERTDNVTITPKPDTFIGFIAYFKPLNYPYTGPQMVLPENPPDRIGFTAIEWGGTIETNTKSLNFH